MNSRIFTLVSSVLALSTLIPSVSAYDFSGCNQVFQAEKLRHGYSYRFWDDYSNLNTYKHQVTGYPSISYSEQYDYNGSTTFPGFSWSVGLAGQGYEINPGQKIRAIDADTSYPIIYRPASRGPENLVLKYTIDFYAQNGGGGNWTGPHTHVECQPYEITWCGDGVKDTDEGETCDDGAQNGQPGKCNVSCNGIVPNPPVNGVCNPTYNGQTLPGPYTWASVSSVVCSAGTPVQGTGFPNGPWTWSCNGQNGGTNASCSANRTPPPIPGVCSTTVTGTQAGPLSTGACDAGSVVGFSANGTNPVNYTWTCSGQNGGASSPTCSANYSAPTPVNGVCNPTYNGQTLPGPYTWASVSSVVCSAGTPVQGTGFPNGPWTWSCNGQNGGTNASCSANRTPPPIPGVCSTTVTGPQAAPLSNGACNAGSVVGFSANGTNPVNYTWTCSGQNGGASSPTCSASYTVPPVNGVCGPTHGATVASRPSTGLCTFGNPTSVSGSGPWTWSCVGLNGGTTANCNANPTPVNGVCGPANGVVTIVAPTVGLCNVGTASVVSGTGPWSWTCAGSNGGTTVTCGAPNCLPTDFQLSIKKYVDGVDAQDAEMPVSKAPGDNATYTIIVKNEGVAVSTGVTTVTDNLPAYISRTGAPSGTGWDCSTSTATRVTCTSTASISAGSNYPTITIPVRVGTGATGIIRNLAVVATNVGNTVPGRDRDPASIIISKNGACSTSISGALASPIAAGACDVGTPINFLSTGMNPIVYSWSCSGVGSGSTSPMCQASYTAPCPGVCTGSGNPILTIKKAAQGQDGQTLADAAQVTPGSAFNYTYTVANTGSGTATGVTVTDTFPRYVSVTAVPTGTDWTCAKGTKTVTGIVYHTVVCSYTKPLTPGATAPVITVPALLDAATPDGSALRNIAYVCRSGASSLECDHTCLNPNDPSCTPPPPPPNCDPMPGSPNYDPACVVSGNPPKCSTIYSGALAAPISAVTPGLCNPGTLTGFTIGTTSAAGVTTQNYLWSCTKSGHTSVSCNASYSTGATTGSGSPLLTIKKAAQGQDGQTLADAAQVTPGSAFNYTYTVANTGSGTATGVTVTDTFPRYVSVTAVPTGTNWTCAKGTKVVSGITYHTVICTYNVPLLAGATAPVITVPALLDAATPDGSALRNIAYVCRNGSTTPECNPACTNPSTPGCTPPPPPPNCDAMPGSPNYDPACVITGSGFKLSIKKYVDMNDAQTSASGYVVSFGQFISYTLVVTNEGPRSTTGTTTVTDTLPTGVTLSGSVTGTNWSCSGTTTIICSSNQVVASGGTFPTITIPVRVTASAGTITNIGIVENPNGTTDPGKDRDPAVILVGNYALSIKKAAQGQDGQTLADAAQVTPGSAFNYTYTVANTGSGTATGVTVTDTFPRYVSVTAVPTGTNWTCAKGTKVVSGITYHTVICTYNVPLLAGATAPVITVPALLDAATPDGSALRNIAYVCRNGSTTPECNPACTNPSTPGCTPPPPPPNCDAMPGSPNYDPACVVVNTAKRCDVLTSNPSASTLAPASSVTYTCSAAGTGFVLSNLDYRISCGAGDTSAVYSSGNTRNCTLPNSYGATQTVTCSVKDRVSGVVFSGSDAGACSVTKTTTGGGGCSGNCGGSNIYYIPKCVNGIPSCTQYVANTLAECNAANGNNCMSHAQCDPAGLAGLSCSGGGGGGYCGDGVLQPYAGEECDVGFSSSISLDRRWCGQPGDVDSSGNSAACKIRITTNPGANPITGIWMTVPRLSNARIGNSQLDVVPGSPNLGRVNFASYQMVLGINTQAFTIADSVGFGIKTGEPIALAVPKNKYFCLGSAGTALNSNNICTTFGALANATYQTYPNVAEPSNPYILIGDGYYQYPSTQNSDGSWNYLGGNASSPNNIVLFRGPTTYGSNTLANAFRGRAIGTDNLTLYHLSAVGSQPIDLVTLPVKVASPMVGTSSTTLSRSSITTFMNSRNVLSTFLSHFSDSTTTSTVTTSSSSSSQTAANNISLGAKNAPVGGLNVYGTTELNDYKLNGNNNVYAVKGNVTLNCTSGITATPLAGVKTLVVENGNLTINCNNSYPSSDTTSSWAFIVKGGNIKISNNVSNLVGVYVTIPEGSTGGKYLSLEGVQTNAIITINGSLYGDASDLFSKRNYLRGTNAYDTLTTGVILSYSNRALVSPPPLLSQYLNNYTVTRVVR